MIGGNTKALLQLSKGFTYNAIGERVPNYETIIELKGFLDMQSQGTNRTTYHAKIEESTHMFICDYASFDTNAENKRLVINNNVYDVMYIDNPMGLNKHIEIYLKYIGGQ